MDGHFDPAHADESIAASKVAFARGLANGDASAAAAVYADDARLLPPSAEPVHGRPAIEAFWRAGLDAGISRVELETLELARYDGLAYEIGRYSLRLDPQDGSSVFDRGKYLLVHECQEDGCWLWAVEMFSPDLLP
jgi:ketosteroid isomerase-like protein